MNKTLAAFVLSLTVLATTTGGTLAASDNNPKADIFQGKADCGSTSTNFADIGFTNFHRSGNVVSIEYHIEHGRPNTTYNVELWGSICSFFGAVGNVTTNAQGVANGNGTVTVPAGVTSFFASSLNAFEFSDTTRVTLNP